MESQFLWAALTLGLAGSLHCVGMCGPIALALGVGRRVNTSFVVGRVLYNLGRAISYSLMGLAFGLIGLGFAAAGLQRTLSIAAGTVMLLFLLLALLGRTPGAGLLGRVSQAVKKGLGKLLKRADGPDTLFAIGIVNGFLPCGLVYLALAGAAGTGHPLQGALFMAVFGLGTLPLMLVVSLAGSRLRTFFSQRVVYGAGLALSALLIVRGLNLGIPYISPAFAENQTTGQVEASCCTPNTEAAVADH